MRLAYKPKRLLLFIALAALLLGVSRLLGYLGAGAFVAACGVFVWAVQAPGLRSYRGSRLLPVTAAGMLVFISSVDRFETDYDCMDCSSSYTLVDYRIIGISIYQTTIGLRASHLPTHNIAAYARRRYWGMLVCFWPCERIDGIRHLCLLRESVFVSGTHRTMQLQARTIAPFKLTDSPLCRGKEHRGSARTYPKQDVKRGDAHVDYRTLQRPHNQVVASRLPLAGLGSYLAREGCQESSRREKDISITVCDTVPGRSRGQLLTHRNVSRVTKCPIPYLRRTRTRRTWHPCVSHCVFSIAAVPGLPGVSVNGANRRTTMVSGAGRENTVRNIKAWLRATSRQRQDWQWPSRPARYQNSETR